MVALKCETDFVAKNADFVALTTQILDLAVANKCKTLDEVKALSIDGRSVPDLITERSGVTGEKMELDRMLNIRGNDLEKMINEAIISVKNDLSGLTDERTCMIYTGYLYLKLLEKHVLSYVIDTADDLGMDYKHQFVIVPIDGKDCYVIDLTYGQFEKNEEFNLLNDCGYQKLNRDMYNKYLDSIKNIVSKKTK